MVSLSILTFLGPAEAVLCVAALCLITVRRQWRDYWALGSFLAVRAAATIVLALLIRVAGNGLSRPAAFRAYFYVYWTTFAIESVLTLFVLFGIFRLTMVPLKGLQRFGMLVLRWAAGICVALAVGLAFAPYMTGTKYLIAAISQLQRTQSVFTVCLLLLVCLAVRWIGLSLRSRLFGVSLGLGLLAINDLVESASLIHHPGMHTSYSLINGVVICVMLITWTAYFALPEPKRRMVVLPATSPLVRWNEMCLAWYAK
jgi:hypothetical protein